MRMAETTGLSVSDAGARILSAMPTSNARQPSESTTGVSIARSPSFSPGVPVTEGIHNSLLSGIVADAIAALAVDLFERAPA